MTCQEAQPSYWLATENAWQDRGFLPDAAYAGIRAGESLVDSGRTRDAAAPLRWGYRIAAGVGARPLAETALAAATVARIRLDLATLVTADSVPPPLDRLTSREREILALVAAGRTNTETK